MNAPANALGFEPPTKQERIDFLKQVVISTEWNIRAYDTKAQICLAAFGLSANPLISIINSSCSQAGARAVLMVTVLTYLASIVTYLRVLWPVGNLPGRLTEGLRIQNIFYIHDPIALGSEGFFDRLSKVSVEPELAAEALKLARIRQVKARRFKVALVATFTAYAVIAISFFLLGKCFD